ncbi:Oxalate:formate exchange protein [Raoultella planticola]|uniref:Oxalate:formate exchange protein n=1 Tax=Raoultella planticola TaxID=575 RepID=A0A485A1P0_RAOPL|nr:Oxalate:formate exchange protein [Raoultella planticola]
MTIRCCCAVVRRGVFRLGEIFSLFPSTLTDTFGSEYASSNYGWLYISQGIGSIFGGPLAALLYQHTQGWEVVFSCAIGLDFYYRRAGDCAVETLARAVYPSTQ